MKMRGRITNGGCRCCGAGSPSRTEEKNAWRRELRTTGDA